MTAVPQKGAFYPVRRAQMGDKQYLWEYEIVPDIGSASGARGHPIEVLKTPTSETRRYEVVLAGLPGIADTTSLARGLVEELCHLLIVVDWDQKRLGVQDTDRSTTASNYDGWVRESLGVAGGDVHGLFVLVLGEVAKAERWHQVFMNELFAKLQAHHAMGDKVDADMQAGPLAREVTGFLRASPDWESVSVPEADLAKELALRAGVLLHYFLRRLAVEL